MNVLIVAKTELIAHVCISSPFGISRDAVVHAYGVDCMYEHGSLVLMGNSINEYPDVDIPPNNSGYFHDRAIVQFDAVISLLSPTSTKVL
jgi:hypothetical protein